MKNLYFITLRVATSMMLAPSRTKRVDDVVSRLISAMEIVESKLDGCVILIVSHGNSL